MNGHTSYSLFFGEILISFFGKPLLIVLNILITEDDTKSSDSFECLLLLSKQLKVIYELS